MNCKPGDLAIVVRSRQTPAAVGMLVEILEIVAPGVRVFDPDGCCHINNGGVGYLCKSLGAPFPLAEWEISPSLYALWATNCLRPIRPGDLEDETPTVRELEAA